MPRYRKTIPLTTTLFALAMIACATTGNSFKRASTDRNLLTETEISSIGAAVSAYDVVALLRPTFLRNGGGYAFAGTVYSDGVRLGDVSQLNGIAALSIRDIRFLNPVQATALFGVSGRSGPAIVVRTKRGGD